MRRIARVWRFGFSYRGNQYHTDLKLKVGGYRFRLFWWQGQSGTYHERHHAPLYRRLEWGRGHLRLYIERHRYP